MRINRLSTSVKTELSWCKNTGYILNKAINNNCASNYRSHISFRVYTSTRVKKIGPDVYDVE